MSAPTTTGLRFLGLNLQPEVRRLFVTHFLIASFVAIMLASFLKVLQQHVFNHDACNVEALTARIKALGRGDPGKLVLWKELIVVSTSPCSGGVCAALLSS